MDNISPYLAVVDGQAIGFVRTLNSKEYMSYLKSSEQLLDFERAMELYEMLCANHETFNKHLIITKQSITGKSADLFGLQGHRLTVNRTFLNLLGMFRTYSDHMGRKLNSEFGKTSSLAEEFKGLCSNAYDSCFAYRFFYKLRNYVQHCGMPVGRFTTSSKLIKTESGDEKPVHELILMFDRDKLLRDYDSWGTTVREELKNMPEYFPIAPIVAELMSSIEIINTRVKKMYLFSLREAASVLRQLFQSAAGTQGIPVVAISKVMRNTPPRRVNLTLNYFRMDLVEQVEANGR